MANFESGVARYAQAVIPRLQELIDRNREVLERVSGELESRVQAGGSLLVYGSGHSAIFPMELYHRAGGASFVIPVVSDFLTPLAGPPVVRQLERTLDISKIALARVRPQPGDMIWLSSQSGINAAAIEVALEAKRRGLFTVSFSSFAHSQAVQSRHSSGKRLMEVTDLALDLGGVRGDALVSLTDSLNAGPFSTLSSIFLGHSILVDVCSRLEQTGTRCVYTSVNTPEGEALNRQIEARAMERDILLRE
jgi:uncharacterized phosphosugar-binding protein